jgi:hypothetical protein
MKKLMLVLLAVLLIAGCVASTPTKTKEQMCTDSGGNLSTGMCCMSVSDYPNQCLIGGCGCSSENSHDVRVCDCGPDKCFNGTACTAR